MHFHLAICMSQQSSKAEAKISGIGELKTMKDVSYTYQPIWLSTRWINWFSLLLNYTFFWKYWYSLVSNGIAAGIVATNGMYQECCNGGLYPEWASISEERIDYCGYWLNFSLQMLQYNPFNRKCKHDASMQKATKMKWKSWNLSLVPNESDELGDGITVDVWHKAKRSPGKYYNIFATITEGHLRCWEIILNQWKCRLTKWHEPCVGLQLIASAWFAMKVAVYWKNINWMDLFVSEDSMIRTILDLLDAMKNFIEIIKSNGCNQLPSNATSTHSTLPTSWLKWRKRDQMTYYMKLGKIFILCYNWILVKFRVNIKQWLPTWMQGLHYLLCCMLRGEKTQSGLE